MQLSESLENYLEAIFHIVNSKGAARAKDIALALKVNNSSVTEALRSLSKKGLVNYAPYDLITLTDDGKELAKVVVKRHETLEDFLTSVLSVEAEEAAEVACRMEHIVNENVIEKITALTSYVKANCPDWDK